MPKKGTKEHRPRYAAENLSERARQVIESGLRAGWTLQRIADAVQSTCKETISLSSLSRYRRRVFEDSQRRQEIVQQLAEKVVEVAKNHKVRDPEKLLRKVMDAEIFSRLAELPGHKLTGLIDLRVKMERLRLDEARVRLEAQKIKVDAEEVEVQKKRAETEARKVEALEKRVQLMEEQAKAVKETLGKAKGRNLTEDEVARIKAIYNWKTTDEEPKDDAAGSVA